MMFDVNLYIEISTRNPRRCGRYYIYVLEYVTKKNEICTAGSWGYEENISLQRIYPLIVIKALKYVKKESRIRIFGLCGGILAPLFMQNKNGVKQLEEWKNKGWLNSAGEPVRNADLWQQLEEEERKHEFAEGEKEHTYKEWMKTELKRRETEAEEIEKDTVKEKDSIKGTQGIKE